MFGECENAYFENRMLLDLLIPTRWSLCGSSKAALLHPVVAIACKVHDLHLLVEIACEVDYLENAAVVLLRQREVTWRWETA
jgi:hypothetical protein